MKPNSVYLKLKSWIATNKIKTAFILLVTLAYYFCLPYQLFDSPYATVIQSKEGELLGAKIAGDGQWRFPEPDSIPYKFKTCIIAFEDQHFYKHFGVNPIAIWNAFRQNQKAGRVLRGGSTLTQQVIRLSRNNKQRTYGESSSKLYLPPDWNSAIPKSVSWSFLPPMLLSEVMS